MRGRSGYRYGSPLDSSVLVECERQSGLVAVEPPAEIEGLSILLPLEHPESVSQSQPGDLPEKNPVPVTSPSGKTYQVTSLFVIPNDKGQGLDLVMKYSTPDISDSGKTFLDNKEAMKALLTKYPEFREIAGNLVARAVAPSGQDFGSELPIKDIK